MSIMLRKFVPFFLILLAFTLIEAGLTAEYADARSKGGGKSFSSAPRSAPSQSAQPGINNQRGSFSRGMMGGLLGGALGGMLFGSMFGAGGSGMGILPILLLGVAGYFLYKKFSQSQRPGGWQGNQPRPTFGAGGGGFSSPVASPPPPPLGPQDALEEGIAQIRGTDRSFDTKYFLEIASDVFFQVQAGWMRRDLDSYRHLLGESLAAEYQEQFEEMRRLGHINKLESIAVRKVDIVSAGSDGSEDFVTVLFTANLLDYTVDEKTNEVVSGSMTTPVKFEEEWTWARPVGTQNWKLEGIKVING